MMIRISGLSNRYRAKRTDTSEYKKTGLVCWYWYALDKINFYNLLSCWSLHEKAFASSNETPNTERIPAFAGPRSPYHCPVVKTPG